MYIYIGVKGLFNPALLTVRVALGTEAGHKVLERGRLPPETPNAPPYKGTSLIRNTPLLGPYRRTISRVLWSS